MPTPAKCWASKARFSSEAHNPSVGASLPRDLLILDLGMLKILAGLFAARQRGVEDGAADQVTVLQSYERRGSLLTISRISAR